MSDRAAKGGGIATALTPGFIQRAIEGVRYLVEGITPSTFFGPNQPLPPQAQEAQGRQFDYPVGHNINISPRSNEGVSFSQLRQLADSCDVLRLVIETHKDRLCRMRWKFQPTDPEAAKDSKKKDPRIKVLDEFFKYPDKEHDWPTWYRMILEDLFVIDAPALYVRKTIGGITGPAQPYAIEIIDGSTICRKINADGRTPLPPSPAYQQVLKGLPAVDYTTEELLYLPRNPRSNKLYGFSPVEQIIMTVNIALRRQLHTLQFYTDGNIPDLLLKAPEQWQPDQIKQFQLFWDTLTDTATRRKGRFIPAGSEPYDTKEKKLKDEFDEWLARIVCFCFSVSPQPFIKEMNRATSETAADTAKEEGLEPILDWTARLLNRIVHRVFGWSDLEATWQIERELDPETQSKIDDTELGNGTATINEVRKAKGRDPVEGGDDPMIKTASGPILVKDAAAFSSIEDEPAPVPGAPAAVPGAPGAAPVPSEGESKGEKEKAGQEGKAAAEDPGKAERVERIRKKKRLNRSIAGGPLY